MEINQRVRELRDFLGLGRDAFAKETGIKKRTIEHIERENQHINGEHLQAITKRYPEYAYWLVTGLELPESGQISPFTEEIRKKL